MKGRIIIGRDSIFYKTFQTKVITISLACCRVFRPGSRPLLNVALDARGQSNAEATLKAIDRDQIW